MYEYGVTYTGPGELKQEVAEWVRTKTHPLGQQAAFDGGESFIEEDDTALKVRIWTDCEPQHAREILTESTPTNLDWVAWVDLECVTKKPQD